MKKIKLVAVIMVMVSILMVVGCVENTSKNEKDTKVGKGKEVVAVVNGEELTRDLFEEEFKEAEKAIIEEYIAKYLTEEYFKDVEVSDVEIEAQFAIIQGQVGQGEWESYLDYIGMPDDDALKKAIAEDLKANKKREQVKESIEVTEEELEKHYNDYKETFDLMVGNIVFFDTEEEFKEGQELLKEGKSVEEIAEGTGKELYENEHVTFAFAGFDKPMDSMEVGDIVQTTQASGVMGIMEVNKIDKTYEAVKEIVKEDIQNQRAEEIIIQEIEEIKSKAEIEIKG